MAITRLSEILKLIVDWEEKLNRFYKMAGGQLKNERSRKVVELLKAEQEKTLKVIKEMDFGKYKNTEFIKNPPDWHREEVILHVDITENSSPDEIFDHILDYEQKLEEYYTHVRDILVYKNDRELMDMLIQFKLNQIKRIKSYMDDYDLAIQLKIAEEYL